MTDHAQWLDESFASFHIDSASSPQPKPAGTL